MDGDVLRCLDFEQRLEPAEPELGVQDGLGVAGLFGGGPVADAVADVAPSLLGDRIPDQHLGELTPVGWDEALDLIAAGIRGARAPEAVAIYGSGQLLTEDYYAANKLMKGFIGSANIDTNSRLCMASSVAGHRRAFGSDTVPGLYEDLELADLVVLTGSNLAW